MFGGIPSSVNHISFSISGSIPRLVSASYSWVYMLHIISHAHAYRIFARSLARSERCTKHTSIPSFSFVSISCLTLQLHPPRGHTPLSNHINIFLLTLTRITIPPSRQPQLRPPWLPLPQFPTFSHIHLKHNHPQEIPILPELSLPCPASMPISMSLIHCATRVRILGIECISSRWGFRRRFGMEYWRRRGMCRLPCTGGIRLELHG